MKKIKRLLTIVISFILVLCLTALLGCNQSGNGGSTGGERAEKPDSVDSAETENLIATSGVIDFATLKEDVTYDGATTLSDASVEITKDGTYLLSGNYTEVTVKKGVTVHIVLKGATISNTSGNAFSTGKNCQITLTVLDENTITNAGDDVNALHVKGTLKINGSGTLTITSDSKSAIKVSKGLYVTGATLNLTAVSHGITASSIATDSATINVLSADKDGLHAECDYDEPDDESLCVFTTEEGFVSMTNTNYSCSVKGDGIQADTFVYIDGGNYNITTEGEFIPKSSENMTTYGLTEDDFRYLRRGNVYQKTDSDHNGMTLLYAFAQGCKGVKVGEIEYDLDGDGEDDKTVTENTFYAIMIKSGTITVDSSDDAVHANSGDIYIYGGTLNLTTLDDGVTADDIVKIYGGEITVESCYEGIEGAYVEILGGTIDVNASDDGLNAATDDDGITEHIIISGGKVTVSAYGDGLDSNGSILISGGTVIVHGPVSGGDGGLDADRGILVTGGSLFVTSALGMVETPAQNSTQYVLSYAADTNIKVGSVVTVKDSDGNEIMSVEIKHACRSIIVSTGEFKKGKTYSLYNGETLLTEFTTSNIITYIGNGSQGTGGGQGGMGGQGGQGGPGGQGGGGTPPRR